MEQRKDKEKILSAGTLLFVACWAAYCASYLGRINYTAALTAIVADGVFQSPTPGLSARSISSATERVRYSAESSATESHPIKWSARGWSARCAPIL